MRAIVYESFGGTEVLRLQEVADPDPGPSEVIVRVRAEAVCGRDLIDRRGGLRDIALPRILGHEFAGTVARVGSDVQDLRAGDRVANLVRVSCGHCMACRRNETTLCSARYDSFGQTRNGGYAEFVAAPESALVKIPEEISDLQAAPLACTAGVALHALCSVARLSLGETLLITGASGGVGTAAIQVARAMGAHVVAATTSDDKAQRLAELGADDVVVTSGIGLHESVRSVVADGVDVALELTGNPTFTESLRSLRPGGRLALVGNIPVEPVRLQPGAVILFGYQILGSAGCTRADLEQVFDLVSRQELSVPIDRTLPLEEAASAHQLLEKRAVLGRVVLLP